MSDRPGRALRVVEAARVVALACPAVAVPAAAGVFVVDCPVCCSELAGPFGLADAGQVAGAHDDGVHCGRVTAEVVPAGDGPEAA